jgi:hypothetical protein
MIFPKPGRSAGTKTARLGTSISSASMSSVTRSKARSVAGCSCLRIPSPHHPFPICLDLLDCGRKIESGSPPRWKRLCGQLLPASNAVSLGWTVRIVINANGPRPTLKPETEGSGPIHSPLRIGSLPDSNPGVVSKLDVEFPLLVPHGGPRNGAPKLSPADFAAPTSTERVSELGSATSTLSLAPSSPASR